MLNNFSTLTKPIPVILMVIVLSLIACKNHHQVDNNVYTPTDKNLFATIIVQDSCLFAAFNTGNFDVFREYFSEDLEIYQDNIGVRNYEQSMNAFQELFEKDYRLTRELIKESLEVYPVKDFGAIEVGQHRFCHIENGKQICGIFKFVHVWSFRDGKWKITRIMTYDHKE